MTLVLVTGATGTVGSSVVRLVRERGMQVRAFVREPRRAASALGSDVDLAVGDLADPSSVATAMKGVDRLFLACANHPRQFEYEANAIDAAAASGVERIVKLSAVGAEIGSPLEFWDTQGRIEQHLSSSGIPAVVVRPTTYMTGVLAAAGTVSRLGKLFVPAGGARISMIDPRDVADVAAVAIGSLGWERTLTVTGPEALTYGEIAGHLAAVLGRPVEYVDVPDDQARSNLLAAGLSDWLATNLVTLFALVRQGAMSETTATVQAMTGRPPRTFLQFATDFAGAFRGP
jgi:uncharacterized protein YbjT (DUF2867 family)